MTVTYEAKVLKGALGKTLTNKADVNGEGINGGEAKVTVEVPNTTKATPGSRGIIEPTISILGSCKIPIWQKATPNVAIANEDTNVDMNVIEFSFIIPLYIIVPTTDIIRVSKKSAILVPPIKYAKHAEEIAVPA